jgi:ABC-type transport system involved in cytochrome c biogenesis permease subunit
MSILQMIIIGMIMIIIATVTLAILSYVAFKVRERRAPKRKVEGTDHMAPMFFERVRVAGAPREVQ